MVEGLTVGATLKTGIGSLYPVIFPAANGTYGEGTRRLFLKRGVTTTEAWVFLGGEHGNSIPFPFVVPGDPLPGVHEGR